MLSGHPRGTWLLCRIELLERTSYYGMRGVLVLLMVAAVTDHGLGWSEPDALAFYGIFTGAVWCAPLVGGVLTDRWLGLRAAVTLGGALLVLGYLSVLTSLLIPEFVQLRHGLSVRELCAEAGLVLGQWPVPGAVSAALSRIADDFGIEAPAITDTAIELNGYLQLTALTFLGGLALVVTGNGFFKPSITVMVGELYRADDPARERAYLLFYMAIYLGVLFAGIGVGTVGERLGWASALVAALLTMSAAFALFVAHRAALDQIGSRRSAGNRDASDSMDIAHASVFIGVHALFAMVFWAAYEQSGGLLNLFIYKQVNRSVGTFEVPATWFFSLTAVVAILLGPILSRTVERLEARWRPLEVSERFAIGLLWGAFAFAWMTAASARAESGAVSLLWPLGFYVLLTIGELLFSPTGFAMVGRLAPRKHLSAFMGLWLLSIALGSYLGGQIGAMGHAVGRTTAFAGLALALTVCATILWVLRPILLRVTRSATAHPT